MADEVLKLPAYDRIDEGLKADLILKASGMSYSRAGRSNRHAEVSRQTVMKCIREVGTLVHLPNCDKKKLGYVHEGAKRNGKRCELQNVHYFATTSTDNESLWTEVLDYIERTYDMEQVDRIYVAGDGARWIKIGQNYLPKSISILDAYHRNKYVRKAAGGDEIQMRRLLDALRVGDKVATAKELKACYEKAENEGHRERVLEVKKYLYDNWKSIENATKYPDVIGCSAEGHVSHVLSDRLSSRPMGWSIIGSDQMSRLRAFVFNGGNIHAALKKKCKNESSFTMKKEENIRECMVKSFENLGNIPILQMSGRSSRTYLTLRAIQHGGLLYR
jgi:hypothetical protein